MPGVGDDESRMLLVNDDRTLAIHDLDTGRVLVSRKVPAADYNRANDTITSSKAKIGYQRLDSATDVAKVSVIGSGMRSHAGVAAQAFKALSERKINIRAITTSEIKFSVLIDAAYTELAVRTLHTLYGLDQA